MQKNVRNKKSTFDTQRNIWLLRYFRNHNYIVLHQTARQIVDLTRKFVGRRHYPNIGRFLHGVQVRISPKNHDARSDKDNRLKFYEIHQPLCLYAATVTITRLQYPIHTWASNLSFVFFELIDMKNAAGKMRHIMTPMVDPNIPSTNSMFGIKMPTTMEINTMMAVRQRNLLSGM